MVKAVTEIQEVDAAARSDIEEAKADEIMLPEIDQNIQDLKELLEAEEEVSLEPEQRNLVTHTLIEAADDESEEVEEDGEEEMSVDDEEVKEENSDEDVAMQAEE